MLNSSKTKHRRFIYISIMALFAIVAVSGCYNPTLESAGTYLLEGNWDGAKEALDDYLKTEPTDAEALFLLGKISAHNQDYDSMNVYFDLSLQSSERFSRKIEYVKLDSWADSYDAAMNSYELGDFEGAIDNGLLCLTIADTGYSHFHYPPRESVYEIKLLLGESYFVQGLRDTAVAYYNDCLAFNPSDLVSLNRLAEMLFVEGRLEEAIGIYDRILEVSPYDDRAARQKILCLENGYGAVAAVDSLLRMLGRQAESEVLASLLVRLYLDLNDYQGARRWLTSSVIANRDAEHYSLLGECNYNLLDFEAAADCFEQVVQAKPNDLIAWEYLQVIYAALNRTEKRDFANQKAMTLKTPPKEEAIPVE